MLSGNFQPELSTEVQARNRGAAPETIEPGELVGAGELEHFLCWYCCKPFCYWYKLF